MIQRIKRLHFLSVLQQAIYNILIAPFKKSLVARVTLSFFILSLISVSLTGYLAYYLAKESLEQSVYERLEQSAVLKEAALQRWVDEYVLDTLILSRQPILQRSLHAVLSLPAEEADWQAAHNNLSERLIPFFQGQTNVSEVLLLSAPDGEAVFSTTPVRQGSLHKFDDYFIQGQLGTSVLGPYRSPFTAEPCMIIATPVENDAGQVTGVLAMQLDLRYIEKLIYDRTGLGNTGRAYLVNADNQLITAESFGSPEFPQGLHSQGIDLAVQGENGGALYLDYAGQPVVGVYRWLPEREVALLVEISQEEAFAPAKKLGMVIFATGLGLVGLLSIIIFMTVRRIARPILALTYSALQAATGNLNQTVPVETEDELGVLASTFNDMTSQLRMLYEEACSNEEHFRTIFDTVEDALILHDPRTGGILTANRKMQEMFGYSLKEARQHHLADLGTGYSPYSKTNAIQWLQKAIREGPQRFEWLAKDSSGRLFWCDVLMHAAKFDGQERVIIEMRDISHRKQADQALQQYAERLKVLRRIDQAILSAVSTEEIARDALPQIFQIIPCDQVDVIEFNYQSAQAVTLAAFARGQSEPSSGAVTDLDKYLQESGLEFRSVINVPDLAALPHLTPFRQKLLDGGIRSLLNFPLSAQDGLVGSLNFGSSELHAFAWDEIEVVGELAEVLSVAMQQARLREEIEQHAAELEERVRQRTAELESFTYSIAHDLKAPLRGIEGYSRLLMDDYHDHLEPEAQDFLQNIRQGIMRMNQLINDLLTYARLERRELDITPLNIKITVTAAVVKLQEQIQSEKVDIAVNVPDVMVLAEEDGLAQALHNLLDNAVKFSQKDRPLRIEIGGIVSTEKCVIWIKDNGIGFEMRFQERIFNIFERLNRVEDFPGTGIGLAVVKRSMQRIGGRVWAESAPGVGSTFYLEIPIQ